MKTGDIKSLYYLENGEILFSNFKTEKTVDVFDPGFYKLSYLPYPENRVKIVKESIFEEIRIFSFPDKEKIECTLKSFFNKNVIAKFETEGFFRKLGIMLHGKEGTGKSSIAKYYAKQIIDEQEGLCFYINQQEYIDDVWGLVRSVRNIQNNPIVIIFDEFDSLLSNPSNKEGWFKNVLDGNLSINNSVVFATTNYIDRIPDAIKDRPSRFKYSFNIEGIQSHEEITSILKRMLNGLSTDEEIDKLAKDLEGSPIDAIKQVCIDKWMNISNPSKKKKKIGFAVTK